MDIKTKLYVQKIIYSFENDLVTIPKSKVTLTLNKAAYVGMCILDFSKALLYEFHYDCIKNKDKYANNSRLLFTETDSLMYEIKTKDVYEDFSMDTKMFDYEDFSMDTKMFDCIIIQLSQNIIMAQTD